MRCSLRVGRAVHVVALRLARFVGALLVLVTMTFAMVHALPGEPVRAALGPKASPETVEVMRNQLGLDDSIFTQYLDYLKRILSGDLGTSIVSGIPVSDLLWQRGPTTVVLAFGAFAVTLLFSIPLGMVAGVVLHRKRSNLAHGMFSGLTGFLASIPDYVMCVVLVQIFAVSLGLFPPAGDGGPQSYILPIAALSLGPSAYLIRLVRAETQRVLDETYMRAARAKRLSVARTYIRHALPNVLVSTLAVSGLLLIGLIAGTVLVESVFGLSGVGLTLVDSVTATDFPAVQGLALFFGAVVLTINLVVDLLIVLADPRSTIKDAR